MEQKNFIKMNFKIYLKSSHIKARIRVIYHKYVFKNYDFSKELTIKHDNIYIEI